MATYYVIDGEDNTLWQGKEKNDAPQKFKTFAAAEKRAMEAAECEPGTEFKIAMVHSVVACPVQAPKTSRAK